MGRDEETSLSIERLTGHATLSRREARVGLLVPLDKSVLQLSHQGATERVDTASMAIVSARSSYRVRPLSPITELLTIGFGAAARRRACEDYDDLSAERLDKLLSTTRVLPRTRWVDELLHRYVFERRVCERTDSRAALFLEAELVKELFFLCRERGEQRTRASVVHEGDDLVTRARGWIDEHLFQTLRVPALARHCHASESTLLRAFQRELGSTPTAYARERRLDAALLLVQDGKHSIGQVASQVGYGNLAAFTAAFHRRFGRPPSAVRRGEAALQKLPPQGAPPRRTRRSD